jgi:5-methylcytosine-specific restriction endonuclease McrA
VGIGTGTVMDVRTKLGVDRKIVRKVFVRDRGICGQCGTDMELIQYLFNLLDRAEDRSAARALWMIPEANDHGRWWTIDHIRPLSMGGDSSMLNLQTLCGPCHFAKCATDLTGQTWVEPESESEMVAATRC